MSHNTHRSPANQDRLTAPHDPPGHPPLSLAVQITTEDNAQSRDLKISEAVDELIPAAFRHRHGILVTQQDNKYTVQVDPTVPCGTIHEKRH